MMERICDRMLVFEEHKLLRLEYGFKEYLSRCNNNIDRIKYNTKEEKLVMENRLAYLIGELSKYTPKDPEYRKLDLEFKELIKIKQG